MAGVPRHVAKLSAGWRALRQLRLGLDLVAVGDQVVTGDESGTRPNCASWRGTVWSMRARAGVSPAVGRLG